MKTFKEKKLEEFDDKFEFVRADIKAEDTRRCCSADIKDFISQTIDQQAHDYEIILDVMEEGAKLTIDQATKAERERILDIIKKHQAGMKEEEGFADFIYGHKKKMYLFKDLIKKLQFNEE